MTDEDDLEKRVLVVDMQKEMVREVMEIAEQAFSKHEIDMEIARHIKEECDRRYYPRWHCLVGRSFTSVMTYQSRHYIHFKLNEKSIVLFKFG